MDCLVEGGRVGEAWLGSIHGCAGLCGAWEQLLVLHGGLLSEVVLGLGSVELRARRVIDLRVGRRTVEAIRPDAVKF